MILVFTKASNETANTMVSTLRGMGVRWARFNRGKFPGESLTVFDPCRPEQGFLMDEDGDRIALGTVKTTWIWHPAPFILEPALSPGQSRFVGSACRYTCRSFLAFLEESSFMVNPLSLEERAEDKGLQLRIARRVGLKVPETLITNSPEDAKAFCARFREVIFKVINPPQIHDDARLSSISTSLLNRGDLAALDGIRQCPGIFQNRVPKRFDLRVTIVGDQVFPVAIHSQEEPSSRVDFRDAWRHGIELRHEVHDLPHRVRTQCLELARELGLVYCAMDLVVRPDGEYVFLEVNPSGQYGWIERATGLPITRALAALLVAGGATGQRS
jgi:glutathione synthase/RimK-type ligase-like ATP-grasp enzyme